MTTIMIRNRDRHWIIETETPMALSKVIAKLNKTAIQYEVVAGADLVIVDAK